MFHLFNKKPREIQYIVQDKILKKQNEIINKFIRISLECLEIKDAAQKMIDVINMYYYVKNSSIFLNNENMLEYLATDVPEEFIDDVKKYINGIEINKDVIFIDTLNPEDSLSYLSAEKRNIKYSILISLKGTDKMLGALYLELDNKKDVDVLEEEILKTVMESMTIALENLILREQLLSLSHTDQLTKLFNRTYLEQYIKILNSKKYSLIMLDIDLFKKINDMYGHKTGDDVLKYVSYTLQDLSDNCKVFRLGGEEFLIISFKDKQILSNLAERIRAQIEQKEFLCNKKVIKFTVSCGVSSSIDGRNFEDVLNKADQELYRAKNTGRNKVCVYEV